MKRLLTILLLVLCCTSATEAQQKKKIGNETPAQKQQRMSWWTHDRFGMFIHFGLYAMPARHEWVRKWESLTDEQYQPYFDLFNPDLYNPKEWAKRAKAAGMKYAVLTTKHHEGFCLFDSKFTDYKSTNTPFKRDIVKEFVEAFRAEGIKVGFYYSLLDWHHPDFPIDELHPQRPPTDDKGNDTIYARLNKGRDIAKYRTYLHNQITELLTKYGKIDIMWLDFSYPGSHPGKGKEDWGSVELLKLIRKLQPGIIVDNRLDLDEYEDGADFATPEQVKPSELKSLYNGMPFETCQTFSGSWGYNRDENSWKTNQELLTLLITSVSKSGNLILNVGPTARGTFDYRAERALDSIAQWMHVNERAIYGCKEAPATFEAPENTMLTYNPVTKRLYIHLMKYPSGSITLKGYGGLAKYTQFLHDNSEIKRVIKGTDMVLTLPEKQPPYTIPVIEVVLK
ncbi:alpha-L-fucosidase [Chitinophaga sp. YR573]|uniref:alpha-L-fucosidase n=1 Tax=Chitinophaga sp. YR573 TaxID=1881040 RepID=UPI0008D1A91C|nr:alpha-L-fucosidase [Chitinophaga sp. YR573]SEW36734.1 alpha-L-fucosidase [Chitinophaga sp. YR573]